MTFILSSFIITSDDVLMIEEMALRKVPTTLTYVNDYFHS